jgi:hypothetical protein
MARARAVPNGKKANKRGSPEAIEKRKVARIFNDVLGGGGGVAAKLDGRTAKRRERLLRELEENKAQGLKELKPLDVLQRVHELLELGEPIASIKKVRRTPRLVEADDDTIELVRRLQAAYSFRPESYRFVGIGEEVLGGAGVLRRVAAKKVAAGRRRS